jgi:trk system potassium uptake protein TrkH
MSLVGAIPYVLSGLIPNYLNAVFEAVSGFTTSGVTVIADIEVGSHAILFWRSLTHWIGGMGVLVFLMAVLPMSGEHSMHIMRAEVPGPTVGKLVTRVRHTARILYMIYIALTLIEALVLLMMGMSFYDALLHAFSTAGTGGFSTMSNSISGFRSQAIETVLGVFMILFGLNFNLYYLSLIGSVGKALKNEELRDFLLLIAASVLVIACSLWREAGYSFRYALHDAFFNVTTVISTTGFGTSDFTRWPEICKWVLILLMFWLFLCCQVIYVGAAVNIAIRDVKEN